jgi:hypothetical protein
MLAAPGDGAPGRAGIGYADWSLRVLAFRGSYVPLKTAGEGSVASLESKSTDTPDETRTPDKDGERRASWVGHGRAVESGARGGGDRSASSLSSVARVARRRASAMWFRAGSTSRPMTGLSWIVVPGDAYRLEPGHDAWVLADESFVALEFESKTAETYAKN